MWGFAPLQGADEGGVAALRRPNSRHSSEVKTPARRCVTVWNEYYLDKKSNPKESRFKQLIIATLIPNLAENVDVEILYIGAVEHFDFLQFFGNITKQKAVQKCKKMQKSRVFISALVDINKLPCYTSLNYLINLII